MYRVIQGCPCNNQLRTENDNGEQQELTVHVPDDQLAGTWANFARVSHLEHEFTLDFVRITPDAGHAIVVSRVAVSPLFITQLIDALDQNWKSYAEKALPKEVRDADIGN